MDRQERKFKAIEMLRREEPQPPAAGTVRVVVEVAAGGSPLGRGDQ